MNNSSATDICVKFGDNTYDVYESKFLDLDVKFADVNGVNLFHVKSFVESYNKVNKEPIIEFFRFLEYDDTPKYLQIVYEIGHLVKNEVTSNTDKTSGAATATDLNHSKMARVIKSHPCSETDKSAEFYNDVPSGSNPDGLLDSNNRWNIPNVIVYCYSQLDNTRGYWVCGEILSRYAQRGNLRFSVMVDKLINAIATFNEQKMSEALQSLTLDNEKILKRTAAFKKECSQACCYMKPEIGKDYVAYVEWIASKNELFIGSTSKKTYMKERAKKNENNKPARYFIYAKDNKFGIQLRDLYRDCLVDLFGDLLRVNKCHLTFKDKVKFNGVQWKVRNCLQRIRVEATTPDV